MHPPKNAPSSPQELLERSYQIAGLTLGELAAMANVVIPADLKRHKGWPGMLIEKWLGATAGSKPQQDFPELGVELKTIPIDKNFNPLETTYVCYAPLMSKPGITWQTSNVRNKLQQVLWVPLEGDRSIPLCERRIATAFFWRPSEQEDLLLQRDWEELTELIVLGEIEKITARLGQALHMRPKAASGSALTDAMNTDGQRIRTRPRGFYLRTAFTGAVLHRQFR